MDSYKDSPVFPFQLNHATPWSGSLDYDADVRQIGGGAMLPTSKRLRMARRLDLQAMSESLDSITEFFSVVRGAGGGFWLPHIALRLEVVGGDSFYFTSRGTALAERWGKDPCQFILLVSPAGNAYVRAVDSVVVSGNNSLVTLDPEEGDLPEIPGPDWSCSLLLYVCLASDELEIRRINYKTFNFDVSVVELPFEYAEKIPATATVYLYELGYTLGTTEAWKSFTNWGVSIVDSTGLVWRSVPIKHDNIKDDSLGAETSLRVIPWADCPVADIYPTHEGLPLRIRIWESGWDFKSKTESGTRQLLFDGEVRKPSSDGIEISAACQSGVDLYTRAVPTDTTSRTCRWKICSQGCGLSAADFSIQATVSGVINSSLYYIDVLAVQALPSSSWLSLGFVGSADYRTGTPSKYWEWRPIQAVTALGGNAYRLQLRTPFRWLKDTDTCWLYHGCAQTTAACRSQMKKTGAVVNNIVNFGGFPLIPLKNPQANTATVVSTSKK